MLEVDDLRVRYGGAVEALRGITLQVPDGKVVAVLGSNGAGKTTLLRAVSSVLRLHRGRVESGSVTIDGVSLTVNEVEGDVFGVNLIPVTRTSTTLGDLRGGDRVNLEIDMLARYAARWRETA